MNRPASSMVEWLCTPLKIIQQPSVWFRRPSVFLCSINNSQKCMTLMLQNLSGTTPSLRRWLLQSFSIWAKKNSVSWVNWPLWWYRYIREILLNRNYTHTTLVTCDVIQPPSLWENHYNATKSPQPKIRDTPPTGRSRRERIYDRGNKK